MARCSMPKPMARPVVMVSRCLLFSPLRRVTTTTLRNGLLPCVVNNIAELFRSRVAENKKKMKGCLFSYIFHIFLLTSFFSMCHTAPMQIQRELERRIDKKRQEIVG